MEKKPDDRDPAWVAHKQRTARPRYDETVFTEVFLARFAAEDSRAVRRFGQLVEDATMANYGVYSGSPEELYTCSGLKAVLADLRRLEHKLVELSNEEGFKEQAHRRLCRLAGRKAFSVARLADAIERAIGLAPEAAKPSGQI